MSLYTDGDGMIQGSAPGNFISLGRQSRDPVTVASANGIQCQGTLSVSGALLIGGSGVSLNTPAGTSQATNTTITIAGTTAGALLFDTKANGSLGTVAYTFNDLVRALKVAGVIAQ